MEICALASGSSGNCFYVGNEKGAILIDAGISARQICERLTCVGKNPERVQAIFITHEHIDHVRGADVFARRFNIPIFTTQGTSENCFLCSDDDLIRFIKNDEIVHIRGMKIETFSKFHHAADPVSYNIYNGKKVSIVTDAGHGCVNIRKHISDSNFLILEANHDEHMLDLGPYPFHLKALIKSDIGHLSNTQAGLCVLEHASKKLKHLVLAHLSAVNNTPETALKTFHTLLKERKDILPSIHVSVREKPTDVFRI